MTTDLSHEERFFVATKCCIYVGGKILVIREKVNEAGHWDLPGGKISKSDNNVEVITSLERELSEELGDSFVSNVNAQLFHVQKLYEKAFHTNDILPFVFLCYILELDEIPRIVLSDEHTNYQWIEESEVETLRPWRNHFDTIVKKAFEFKDI